MMRTLTSETFFLSVVLGGWFVPILWHAFWNGPKVTIQQRLIACQEVMQEFTLTYDFNRAPQKRKKEQHEIMLDETYMFLKRNIEKTQQAETVAHQEKVELNKTLNIAKEKLKQFVHEGTKELTEKISGLQKEINKLEKQLESNQVEIGVLQQRLVDLELETEKAYTKKQILAAKAEADLSKLTAHKADFALKTVRVRSRIMIGELQRKVDENESRAAVELSDFLGRMSNTEIEKMDFASLNTASIILRSAWVDFATANCLRAALGQRLEECLAENRAIAEDWKIRADAVSGEGKLELEQESELYVAMAQELSDQCTSNNVSILELRKRLSIISVVNKKLLKAMKDVPNKP